MLRAIICRSIQRETIVTCETERGNVQLTQLLWSRKLHTALQWACLWSPACRVAGGGDSLGQWLSVWAGQPSPLNAENLLSLPGSRIDGFPSLVAFAITVSAPWIHVPANHCRLRNTHLAPVPAISFQMYVGEVAAVAKAHLENPKIEIKKPAGDYSRIKVCTSVGLTSGSESPTV